MGILGHVARVVAGHTQVQHDVQQKAQAQQRGIGSIARAAHGILHTGIDAQDVEGLHQQVEHQQQGEVQEEGTLHVRGAKVRIHSGPIATFTG